MPTLTIDETDLYYERRGAGEPLLLIQGLGGHSLHWGDAFLGALEDDFELVLYDHRGAGRSGELEGDVHDRATSPSDAAAVLDALEVESAHVLGISMGGMVAQELVLAHPERVRTLTLGCSFPGGRGGEDDRPGGRRQMIAEAVLSGDRERAVRAGYEIMIVPEYAADPANYEHLRARRGAVPGADPDAHGAARGDRRARHERAAGGDRRCRRSSSTARPTGCWTSVNGELLARLIPGARLELLEGVGHMFFWEQPERSAELVREHIAAAARAQRSGAVQRGGEAPARTRARADARRRARRGRDDDLRTRSRSSLGSSPLGDRGDELVEAGLELAVVERRECRGDRGAPRPRARCGRRGRRRGSCPATLAQELERARAVAVAVEHLGERERSASTFAGSSATALRSDSSSPASSSCWVSDGTSASKNASTWRGRLGADELGHDLAVDERLDGRDALDAELLGDVGVGVGVDLRQHDLALARAAAFSSAGPELAARGAPLGPEVDDHGYARRALDDLGLEVRFVYVDDGHGS